MKTEVDLEGGVVMEARLAATGCEVFTKASAALARLARGRGRSEALGLDITDVTERIGPVDEEHEQCVRTAISALRTAIVDAYVKASP